jgi:hypothetical protein
MQFTFAALTTHEIPAAHAIYNRSFDWLTAKGVRQPGCLHPGSRNPRREAIKHLLERPLCLPRSAECCAVVGASPAHILRSDSEAFVRR